MKLRVQSLILLLPVMLALTCSTSYAQTLTAITESDVEAMMNAIDKAMRKGNVDGVIAFFAPNVKIKVSVLNPGSTKELEFTPTKDEFAVNLRHNMRRKLSYRLERKNTRIKIYDAETAMVTYESYETLKFPEGTSRASSSEVLYLSLRDGKLVITAMETRTRLY